MLSLKCWVLWAPFGFWIPWNWSVAIDDKLLFPTFYFFTFLRCIWWSIFYDFMQFNNLIIFSCFRFFYFVTFFHVFTFENRHFSVSRFLYISKGTSKNRFFIWKLWASVQFKEKSHLNSWNNWMTFKFRNYELQMAWLWTQKKFQNLQCSNLSTQHA